MSPTSTNPVAQAGPLGAAAQRVVLPLPPSRRKRRLTTPTISMAVSGLFHALLILGAAAVVWRTTVTPVSPGPSARIAFENPGDGPLPAGVSGAPLVASEPYALDGAPGEGSLAPLLASPPTDEPLVGLTTETGESRAAGGSLGGMLGSALAASPLFSGVVSQDAAGARAGADGQASVTFGGLGASSVSSVVYVVDCSGPMVTSLPLVLAELERSVGRLSQTQRFGVVLFRRLADSHSGAESFAPMLVRATPSAKQLLHDWLAAVEPEGRSSPLAGVEAAVALKPDAIFLLSRSIQRSGGGVWEYGLEPTMARLEQLNAPGPLGRRPVLIQTIQFMEEDPTGIMQAIGQRHGGGAGYRVVKRQQDLNPADASKTASPARTGAP